MPVVLRAARALAVPFAFAALVPLFWLRFSAPRFGSGDGSVGNGLQATYHYGDLTAGFHVIAIALAILVAAGAAGLWRGASAATRFVALLAATAGLALTPVAVAAAQPDSLTAAAARAIRKGMTRAEVSAIAGRPAGTGEAITKSGQALDCVVYHRDDANGSALFCFDGDRLAEVSE